MANKIYYDDDLYFAMLKSMNEDLNIEPDSFEEMEAINETEEKEEIMRWWGMVYNFNGMNVKELKHPFFQS